MVGFTVCQVGEQAANDELAPGQEIASRRRATAGGDGPGEIRQIGPVLTTAREVIAVSGSDLGLSCSTEYSHVSIVDPHAETACVDGVILGLSGETHPALTLRGYTLVVVDEEPTPLAARTTIKQYLIVDRDCNWLRLRRVSGAAGVPMIYRLRRANRTAADVTRVPPRHTKRFDHLRSGWALAALLWLVAAPDSLYPQDSVPLLKGRVADAVVQTPVLGADVRVVLGSSLIYHNVTGADGRFAFAGVTRGVASIRITRIGYRDYETSVQLQSAAALDLTILLQPVPLGVSEVVASGTANRGRLEGFSLRKRGGVGRFITRAEIDEKKPLHLVDLLRGMPGVKILPTSVGGAGRVAAFGRSYDKCGPAVAMVYVDGILYSMSDFGLNDIPPDDVEAIEVYSGASRIPAEFNRPGGRIRSGQIQTDPACGVIVIWTRNGH